MPNEDDVLINFTGNVEGLTPVENALDGIIAQSGEVGQAWKKTAAAMATGTKTSTESTNKLSKSIEALGVAAKSADKAVIGGAYASYLKQIQAQLGLTNKEVIAYIQNARKAAQESIFSAGTDEEIDQLTLSIEAMNDQLKVFGAAEDETGTKTQTLRARIREAKEELVAMAEAGLAGTPAFNELQQKAGQLDDQMRDLNQTIKGVGSDTRNIDGVISLVGGLAGGFAVAQGAAALFGNESEDVQKALLKVNAAMSILQGLQQIQNLLQKESAAMLLLSGINTKALAVGQQFLTVTTLESAAATTALRAALIASGIGAIIVLLGLAAAAFNNMNVEIESSADRMERLTKKADVVYEALQKLSKINQAAVDRDVDLVKNKELVNVLEAQGASITEINKQKKLGLGIEAEQLRDELLNVESAKEIAEDKTQFVERELEIKSKIYSNSKAQLVLDIETNKVQSERTLKSASALADAEVARKKLAIVQNQVDSIASIKAVSDAEINAIRRKRQEETRPGNGLTSGEIAKINADADLAIAENRKALQQDLLKIETDGIEAKVLLSKKGSEDEYINKVLLLEKEKAIALANAKVAGDNELKIQADFLVKKRDLDRQYEEQKMENEISFLNAYIGEFEISEGRKLELTIRRLDMQRDLEISQAEGNAAKIKEINAKYDKESRDAKKASLIAELDDRLKTLEVFNEQSNQANQRILQSSGTSNAAKIQALQDLQDFENQKLDIQQRALTDQVEQNLLTAHEFDVAYQDILNKRALTEEETQKNLTAIYLQEIEKRTAAIQATFAIFQKGLSTTLDTSALTTALTEFQNFGTAVQDIMKKVKLGTIEGVEALKVVGAAALGVMQNVVNQSFTDSAATRQQILADTLQTLQDQKAKELDNKNLTEQQKSEIDKKFREKEKQEKIKAFQADKEAKKTQAIINGALAVTNALLTTPLVPLGLIMAALVAVSTAIQVAKINSTPVPKFKHGKVDIQGPGTTTSDSIPSMISKGESVINADATTKWKEALEAINTNKFEHYITHKLSDFIFPHVPDHIQPSSNGQAIDYSRLAKEIATEMKGIIPGHKSTHVNIDKDGIHTIVVEGSSRTEYKNKRYSMT
jgi:hypothetical protein